MTSYSPGHESAAFAGRHRGPQYRIPGRDVAVSVAPTTAAGFTLIELMVAVALAGIIVGVALPALQQFSDASAVRRGVDELSNGFLSARTMAVTNRRPVTICALDGEQCSANVSDWADGWAVFQECGATNQQIDADTCDGGPETVFARGTSLSAALTAVDANDADAPTRFVFESDGMLSIPVSEDWPVRFELAAASGSAHGTLFLNQLGRVCVELRDAGNCD